MPLNDAQVARLISAEAQKRKLDPEAVLSVSAGEGGVTFRQRRPGDRGTSFGPFQLHWGGAMPKKYWGQVAASHAFANSPAGVRYVLDAMVRAGAAGLHGEAAVNAIIRNFERPKRPDVSVANALARYGSMGAGTAGGTGGDSNDAAASLGSFASPDFRQTLAGQMLQSASATARGERQPGALLGLAMSNMQSRQQQQAGGDSLQNMKMAGAGGLTMPLSTPLGGGSEFHVQDAEGAPGKGGRFHAGKDWFAPPGSTVRSPWQGKIVEVTASRGNSGQVFGGVVKVQRKDGKVFVARHVDPSGVKIGQRVSSGQPIAGVTDWTGGGDHAHIEVWKSLRGGYNLGNMLDPVSVFGGRRR